MTCASDKPRLLTSLTSGQMEVIGMLNMLVEQLQERVLLWYVFIDVYPPFPLAVDIEAITPSSLNHFQTVIISSTVLQHCRHAMALPRPMPCEFAHTVATIPSMQNSGDRCTSHTLVLSVAIGYSDMSSPGFTASESCICHLLYMP